MVNVLSVQSSARTEGSISRELSAQVIDKLRETHGDVNLVTREADAEIPLLSGTWLMANFTPADQRDESHRQALRESDEMVDELKNADIIVIGAPIYNFTIPGSLKAWLDLVCRAGLTFNYTENGPVGLLENKKAIVVVASGGTPVNSEIDFHTPYMKHVLGFIGIHDVEFVAADRLMADQEAGMQKAREEISALAA